jgi:hypothetical protein
MKLGGKGWAYQPSCGDAVLLREALYIAMPDRALDYGDVPKGALETARCHRR